MWKSAFVVLALPLSGCDVSSSRQVSTDFSPAFDAYVAQQAAAKGCDFAGMKEFSDSEVSYSADEEGRIIGRVSVGSDTITGHLAIGDPDKARWSKEGQTSLTASGVVFASHACSNSDVGLMLVAE